MKLAAIAGFAAGTAIVVYAFLRQHSTPADPDMSDEYDFSNGQRGVYYDSAMTGVTADVSLIVDGDSNYPQHYSWTFTPAELGEPT